MDHLAATIAKSMFRPRGQLNGRFLNSVDYYSIMIKMSFILCSPSVQLPLEEQRAHPLNP